MTPALTATNPPSTASSSNPATHRAGAPDTAMIVTTAAAIIKIVPISGCKTIKITGIAATPNACSTSLLVGSLLSWVRSDKIMDIPIMIAIFANSAG